MKDPGNEVAGRCNRAKKETGFSGTKHRQYQYKLPQGQKNEKTPLHRLAPQANQITARSHSKPHQQTTHALTDENTSPPRQSPQARPLQILPHRQASMAKPVQTLLHRQASQANELRFCQPASLSGESLATAASLTETKRTKTSPLKQTTQVL